jgi:hypothetical protein
VKRPIKLFKDNSGHTGLAKITKRRWVKHTDIKYHFIREKFLGKEICSMFVKSQN